MTNCCTGNVFQISFTNGDFREYDMDWYFPEDLIKIIKYYYKQHILREMLVEDTRTALVTKSRSQGAYKDQSHGKNRFERKKYSKIANTVKQYNKIDMNDLFKRDTLVVKIPVIGETDTYYVTIKIEGVVAEIAKNVKNNNNKLEYRTIIQSLTKVFNTTDVYVNCTCPDHLYNYDHWNIVHNVSTNDTAHDPGPGKGIRNPNDDKGRGCKHVLLVLANGDWLLKVASVINNYIHYAEESLKPAFLKHIFPKVYGCVAEEAIDQGLLPEDFDLKTDSKIIDTINEYGRNRGKYLKGSNKNPTTGTGGRQKKEEPADEKPVDKKENEQEDDTENK